MAKTRFEAQRVGRKSEWRILDTRRKAPVQNKRGEERRFTLERVARHEANNLNSGR